MTRHASVSIIVGASLLLLLAGCASGAPFNEREPAGHILEQVKASEGAPVAIRETKRDFDRDASVELTWAGVSHYESILRVLDDRGYSCQKVSEARAGESQHCADRAGHVSATVTMLPAGSGAPLYGRSPAGENLRGKVLPGVSVHLEISK